VSIFLPWTKDLRPIAGQHGAARDADPCPAPRVIGAFLRLSRNSPRVVVTERTSGLQPWIAAINGPTPRMLMARRRL